MKLGVFTKKYFFDSSGINDIFWYGKKIHDFCSKINNSKYLQNTKKIFAPWKSLEYQLSIDIRFSTQTKGMTEIFSNEKKNLWVATFFLGGCTVVDKKNAAPFGTFFARIISLWVFETQTKNWYHWREEILNFVMMCLVFSYFHPFERYWCVSENGTLCSQSRLIHFDSSNIQKIFIFENFNKS